MGGAAVFQISSYTTFALGVTDCKPQCSVIVVASMHEEPARERARAIVSPASGEIVFTVPGNAAPVAVAPAYSGIEQALAPVNHRRGAVGVGAHVAAVAFQDFARAHVQPDAMAGPTRRPLTSSSESWNAMFAGTFMRTEPSGSTGA